MAKLWDITPTVTADLAVWPGDSAPRREVLMEVERGDSVTLSTLHATVHLGAHADAPSHYGAGAATIETRPPATYLGRCLVVDVDVARGARIPEDAVRRPAGCPRVLFKTGTYPDPRTFNEDFAALSAELVARLAAEGVILVGIDTPSVDLFSSKDLPAHHACLRADMAILEGLVLQEVPAGEYELIAPPLKLAGFDASPVRALLRELADG